MPKPAQVLSTNENAIDAAILPMVNALRALPLIETLGSCSGHADDPHNRWHGRAYVSLCVRGMKGLRLLVAMLEGLDAKFGFESSWDAELSYSSEVATSCNFEAYPDWIMFEMRSKETLSAQILTEQAKYISSFSP